MPTELYYNAKKNNKILVCFEIGKIRKMHYILTQIYCL